ncbi:unnamed protein product [Ceutorhynchus assimilis]|uniref:Uncharacterized protein n=1 Tax=Ceutorhynchus assimilis TaxID=467358 RepID=A0A9N9MTA2_9CUCU|nr:unnamed protein product [Ceutorhynchus assimilis]
MTANRWNDIQKNIQELTGKEFGVRSLKERIQLLVDKFRQKVEHDEYKSGIEEEVTEMDDLLHQIILLIDEVLNQKKTKSSSYQRGLEKREQAMENITKEGNQIGPLFGVGPNLLEPPEEDKEYIQVIIEDEQDMQTEMQSVNKENNFVRPIEPETPRISIGIGRGNGRRVANRGRSGGSTPSRLKRTGIKQTSMKFLETKNERWFETRRRELDLEERRFEFDMEERRRNLAINEARLDLEQK